MRTVRLFAGVALVALVSVAAAVAQTTPTRLRGTIAALDGNTVTIATREGNSVNVKLADNWAVALVAPLTMADIKQGSFVGIASLGTDADRTALEVLVFPESARGTAEGHSAWDLQPGSQMTNATVATIAPGAKGRTMTLRYKDGEKTIVVPEGVPVVTLKPGDRSLLVAGAKVIVTAQNRNGQATALRITAGRNGFAPPM